MKFGFYDVQLETPGEETMVLESGFEVVPAQSPELQVVFAGVREGRALLPVNDGPFELWQTTVLGSDMFEGTVDNTYRFYCVATDLALNSEVKEPVTESVITVEAATHIVEAEKPQLQVFPNPARDYVTIQMSNHAENLNFSIYDLTGKQISTGYITGEQQQISTSHLQEGLYIIRIILPHDAITRKIQIIR